MKIKVCTILVSILFLFLIFNQIITAEPMFNYTTDYEQKMLEKIRVKIDKIREQNEQRMSEEKIQEITRDVRKVLNYAYEHGYLIFDRWNCPLLYEIIEIGMCEIWYENTPKVVFPDILFIKMYFYVYLPVRLYCVKYYYDYPDRFFVTYSISIPVFTRIMAWDITKMLLKNLKEIG